ncbi:MAG TPA: STAS domain-containing protein [Candidatus Paceibacterota bacterium]|nr:STAS domain-containing protein [Candidatus Paceibacterota bacterium]
MDSKVATRTVGDVVVVDHVGRIVWDRPANRFGAVLHRIVDEPRRKVLINLARTTAIDAFGIGKLAKAGGISVKTGSACGMIVRPRSSVDRLVRLTEMHRIIPVYFSEEEALEQFPATLALRE